MPSASWLSSPVPVSLWAALSQATYIMAGEVGVNGPVAWQVCLGIRIKDKNFRKI